MNNPCAGRGLEEDWRIAGQKAAERSGKKEAEIREKRKQILDYYKRKKIKRQNSMKGGE